jgi:hypothetical protein
MGRDSNGGVPEAAPAGAERSASLGGGTVVALMTLGAVLIGASLVVGFFWIVGIGVGLSEPRRPTGAERALFTACAAFGFLLLGTGIASLTCGTRRGLWGVGALAAATAATLALAAFLEPAAERAACGKFAASQSNDGSIDRAVLADCLG